MRPLLYVIKKNWFFLVCLWFLAGFAIYLHSVSEVKDKSLLIYVASGLFALNAIYIIAMVSLRAWYERARNERSQ